MSTGLKFDLYGRLLLVERQGERCLAFFAGAEGKRRPAGGIVIPPDLTAEEVGPYLEELCHEYATAKHPAVRRL